MNKFEHVWGEGSPCLGVGVSLFDKVQCIMANGHMGLPSPWTHRMTDTTENITFSQLSAVMIKYLRLASNAHLGEMVEDSGSEDEEDGGGAEEYEKEQREKLEQERAAIMSDSTLIAEVSKA